MKKQKPHNYTHSRHTFKTKAIAYIGSFVAWISLHLLFLTCRKYIFGRDVMDTSILENNGKVLTASWHRSIFYTTFFGRNRNAALMSSRSRDGEFVTGLLHRFGYYTPRGSSGKGKGGQEALEDFIEHVNRGNAGGLAVDAPKGPPYVSKHGIINAAARTGAPILPHCWYAQPNMRIKSWDRSIVPKPFSKIVLVIDRELMYIPSDLTKDDIEMFRQKLNNRILHLTYQADHWFELRDKYPDPRDIPVPDPVPLPYHPSFEK